MNPILKILLYLVLVASAVVFGQRFFATYSHKMEVAAGRLERAESTNAPTDVSVAKSVISPQAKSTMGIYAAAAFGVLLALGLLVAYDLSQYFAHRAHRALYNEEGEGIANPEYEQAEQVWADGDHLEAIRLMREYLIKNPREQHVALRIAEIYEKDLSNPLAAALEYEEVLTKKLHRENWGWAAIHLCNLYYRLNKPDKALALLQRIDAEYSETAAAEKARKRLAMHESGGGEPIPEETAQGPGEAAG
jgi:hypothetical protein